MSISAIIMALFGIATLFLPEELLRQLGTQPTQLLTTLVQVLGALYLGFAALNWLARNSVIGGIYGRPLALGNLGHFMVAALVLIRALSRTPALQILWVFTVIYVVFAIGFALLLFRHPGTQAS